MYALWSCGHGASCHFLLPQEYDATLADFIGPGVDKAFDELLESLARIAQKQVKLVIDAVSRWKKGQHEQGLPDVIVQRHLTGHVGRGTRIDIQDRLIKRRDVRTSVLPFNCR
jgi:hypothetical protein